MNSVPVVKNIGSKPGERKPAQDEAKVRKYAQKLVRTGDQSSDAKIHESRIGLMLDVNA